MWARCRAYLKDVQERPLKPRALGFTLLEVVIALAILALSLTVFLSAQVASLASADRVRNLTLVTLLARSKMIDIEQELLARGFTFGDSTQEGNFSDEGHSEIKWKYKVSEVELNLASLASLCSGLGGGEEDKTGAKKAGAAKSGMDCSSVLGGAGGLLGGFTENLNKALRTIDLVITLEDGKYNDNFSFRTLITKEEITDSVPANPAGLPPNNLLNPPGGTPGGIPLTAPPSSTPSFNPKTFNMIRR